jgi:uncharacterized phage-like protein YoqJ
MIFAATGHRPQKLGGFSPHVTKKLINLATTFLYEHRPGVIISGMALGWDLAWAEAGILLKIPVMAAVPFEGQESKWPQESQERYHHVLSKCSEVRYVCDNGFASWKMQKRNEFMVDRCDRLIALWDGSTGGTGNCIKYATSVVKPIINLWEKFNEG